MKKILNTLPLLLIMIFASCNDEPIGDMNLNYEVLNEELYDLVSAVSEDNGENAIDCIEFNYPFAIFVFDENLEFVEAISITSNFTFSNFLGSLHESYSISINYPITGTLNNGELVDINNNQELKMAIDDCVNEEERRRCNNTLVDCVWQITSQTGAPNEFQGAFFKVNSLGIVQFHYKNDIYFGNWVTLNIGDELFLNIDLNDDAEIEEFWDFNWKVNLLNDQLIDITNNNYQVRIEKDCSIPCELGRYQVCELENEPGIGEFSLQKYTSCIGIPPAHDVVTSISYTFFETEEDAINNTNPISPAYYQNSENPQTMYVRISYRESGELLFITDITIEAIVCT